MVAICIAQVSVDCGNVLFVILNLWVEKNINVLYSVPIKKHYITVSDK